MPINVVWFGAPGKVWKNCTVMLTWMLETYECNHYFGDIPDGIAEAVVVVHGESCLDKVARLKLGLEKLKSVILIYLGDEHQLFPIERVQHPNMKLYIQDPDPKRAGIMDRFLPGGYAPGCAHVDVARDLDFFFAGQITHDHRRACMNAIDLIPGGGFTIRTRGYTQGISAEEYYRCLSRAKFVPCPSGPISPDSTRVWESLECGAIPILDAGSPIRSNDQEFWKMALGDHPLPVIQDWSYLPTFLPLALEVYEDRRDKVGTWWADYKAEYLLWLKKDIEELTNEPKN